MALPPIPPTPGVRLTTEQVYLQYLPYVRYFVRRSVEPQQVDDLIQAVFCAIERTYPNYDHARPLKPWIRTVALRVLRDFNELAGEQGEDTALLEDLTAADLTVEGPERDQVDEERQALLEMLLKALDEKELRVVQRTWIAEAPLQDVAKELGTTYGKLVVVRRRALRKMRAALQRHQARDRHKLGGNLAILPPFALARSGMARLRSLLGHVFTRAGASASSFAPAAAISIAIAVGAAVVPPLRSSAARERPSRAITAPAAARVAEVASSAPIPATAEPTTAPPSDAPRAIAASSAVTPAAATAEQRSLSRICAMLAADPVGAIAALDWHKKIFASERLRGEREIIEMEARTKVQALRQGDGASPRP